MLFKEKEPLFQGRRFDGEVDGFFVQVQVFDEPSHYGIAKGRISRLVVLPNANTAFSKWLANYDRGWDGGPPTERVVRAVVEKTVRYFDQKDINWSFEADR